MADINDRVGFNAHLHKVATAESVVRAAESRVQVLQGKANRDDKYADAASEAHQQLSEAQDELEALVEERDNWGLDLEGTKNTLSDKAGNFAVNARVARVGGTHIEGSNSVENSTEPATDPEEAGTEIDIGAPVVQGYGGGAQTLKGEMVSGPMVADGEPVRKRGSKKNRRAKELEKTGDEA